MDLSKYQSGAVSQPPAAPTNPSVGYPTAASAGVPATKPGAYWFYQIAQSFKNLFTYAGITPSWTNLNGLLDAVRAIVNKGTGHDSGALIFIPPDAVSVDGAQGGAIMGVGSIIFPAHALKTHGATYTVNLPDAPDGTKKALIRMDMSGNFPGDSGACWLSLMFRPNAAAGSGAAAWLTAETEKWGYRGSLDATNLGSLYGTTSGGDEVSSSISVIVDLDEATKSFQFYPLFNEGGVDHVSSSEFSFSVYIDGYLVDRAA